MKVHCFCRNAVEHANSTDDADEPESGFMKSFKVATFEFAAAQAPKDSKLKPHFWEDMLHARHLQLQEEEQERLGKGKRFRKKVWHFSKHPGFDQLRLAA